MKRAASWVALLLALGAFGWAASESVLSGRNTRMSDALPLYLYAAAVLEGLNPLDPANLPSFDELLATLPCEPEERVVQEERMAEAYYNAGLDYREKLNDNEKAIETWVELKRG